MYHRVLSPKLFIITGVLLIVAGVGYAGLMIWRDRGEPQKGELISDEGELTGRDNKTGLSPDIDTSGWKIYRNERKEGEVYKLVEIRLPQQWKIDVETSWSTHIGASSPDSRFRFSLRILDEDSVITVKDGNTGEFSQIPRIEFLLEQWEKHYKPFHFYKASKQGWQRELTSSGEFSGHLIKTDLRVEPYIYSFMFWDEFPERDEEISSDFRELNNSILATFHFIQ